MSRELVAKAELDRVEKMLEEAGIIRNGEVNLAKLFINDTSESLNTLAKDKLEKLKHGKSGLFLVTQAGNIAVDLANGEAGVKTALNLAVDTILFVAQVTPVGMAIYRANLVASHFGYDIGSLAGEIYDWATKGDKYKDYITQDGFLRVVMDDGTVYMRPLKGRYGLATGNYMNDVLFGGNKNDTLQGGNGSDLLIGGDGFDTYNAGTLDIIRDSDGKSSVHFNGYKLTGGTYDKDRDLYISDDYIKYKLHNDGRLEVSYIGDNITIENFNKDNNDLGIILIDPKDIVVTIHDNQSTEGGNGKHSMEFKITLNRTLKKDEFLELIINGQRIKFKEGDIEQTYTHTWDGNTIKEEDRKFKVSGYVLQSGTSKNLNVKYIHPAKGLIKDDDKDPNDDKPETYDPLVIDLNNDGIKDTNLDYKINFDLDNNGFKEATSWIDNNDAFIAIDKNNNGTIDNGSELFGNKSISNNAYAYTNPNAKNGFESLKEFDSNNDDIINEKDKEFTNLLLWQDKNSNGISETDELIKLSDKAEFANLNLLVAWIFEFTKVNLNLWI